MAWSKRYPAYQKPEIVEDITFVARLEKLLNVPNLPANYVTVVKDFQKYHNKNNGLTAGQVKYLLNIENQFNDDKIRAAKTWNETWDAEKARVFHICCKYYAKLGQYWKEVAAKGLADPAYIPSENVYNKMVTNKYAMKVIAAVDSEATFTLGSYVMVRKSPAAKQLIERQLNWQFRNKIDFSSDIFIVVENESDAVASSAVGSKPYRIMKIDDPAMIFDTEERFLRKASKKLVGDN